MPRFYKVFRVFRVVGYLEVRPQTQTQPTEMQVLVLKEIYTDF